MASSLTVRTLQVLVAASIAFHTPAFAENWVSLNPGQVDRDSLRREGSWVFYRARNGPIWPASENRVDCSQIGASEIMTYHMVDGAWRELPLPSNSIGADWARYACSAV